MHAPSLLKSVLTPRGVTPNTSGQPLERKNDSNSRGATRSSSPDPRSASLSITKSVAPPKPVKMSCLCAPTNHAGSFRCRLHRGVAQPWGSKPAASSDSLTPSKSAPPASPKVIHSSIPVAPSSIPVAVENGSLKRAVVFQLPTTPRLYPMNYTPSRRSHNAGPSRLSRVVMASDLEPRNSDAEGLAPAPVAPVNRGAIASERYSKSNQIASCASGAVLDSGFVFFKKLQSGGKDAKLQIRDGYGCGTRFSRVEMTV